MFTYLLFDLDGTLTDPGEGITKSVQYALAAAGIQEPDLKKLEIFIGPPIRESFMEFYHMTAQEAEQCVAKYRERYAPTGVLENQIYPGIPEALSRLKAAGKKMAIASSKPTVFVNKVLEHFDIKQYFDIIIGCELNGVRGKKEEVVEEALRQLRAMEQTEAGKDSAAMVNGSPDQVPAGNIVMIGDRKYDVEGAKAFGLVSIGVTFGYAQPGELEAAGADYIVDSVPQLEALLMEDVANG